MCAKYIQSLLYKCKGNQFNVQVYTKPVYRTSVHKTSLLHKCNWSIKKGMYMDRQYEGMYRDGTLPTGFVYIINQ